MTDKTPIREAAEAVTEALSPKADGGLMWGERIQTGIADAVEAIILGVLRERVPEKTVGEIGYTAVIEAAKGYNQCRKEIGL